MHLISLFTGVSAICAPCFAARLPFYQDVKYNTGEYGSYVTQKFKSNANIIAPVLNFMKPFTACDDGSYLFITPRGHVASPKAMIMDSNGSVVWITTREYGKIYDLRVQEFRGKPHLTFWGGSDVVDGHGVGYHYVLNQNYQEVLRFSGIRDAGDDLHVFTITPQNTAIFMYYNQTLGDTSSVSSWRARGWIWDPVFYEIDLDSQQIRFSWSTLGHMNVTDSTVALNAASPETPWDPFHLNSVVKDSKGNYLLSLRYTNALVYIDGKTGAVLWQLGGKSNSFRDLSGGEATRFAGQHDAQWVSEGHIISLFDNRADWYHQIDSHSRGIRIRIDTNTMTAEVDQVFESGTKVLSASQGSYQTLPNGNVLLGYGFNAVFTEFSSQGEVLCDAYFQPASTFGTGNVQSYHSLKFNWTGMPETIPDIMLDAKLGKIFVSWNGATEVKSWLFQSSDELANTVSASGEDEPAFRDIGTAQKVGFETEYSLAGRTGLGRSVRAVALDSNAKHLGQSKVVNAGSLAKTGLAELHHTSEPMEDPISIKSTSETRSWLILSSPLAIFFAICVILLILVRFRRKRIIPLTLVESVRRRPIRRNR